MKKLLLLVGTLGIALSLTTPAFADEFADCKKKALTEFGVDVITGGLGIPGIIKSGNCEGYLDPNNPSHREYWKFKWQLKRTWDLCGSACF